MVDVCKTLNLDYMAACPGSTFRAIQESFINYGQNKRPEWLTCLHEEVSVGMAHGYAKVAGKPMAAIVHGTVGTQHAAMGIYNTYCDRVPMLRHPTNQMPPYEAAVLSDQDAADLYAYVRQMPTPRDPNNIPLLKAER